MLAGSASAEPFNTSYAVELTRGPVVAPSRIVGMGGAYVSIAEGAGAYELNPASAAIRSRHNKDELWDWDFSLEAIVAARDSNDFENNRRAAVDESEMNVGFGSIGFVAEEFGFGVSISLTALELQPQEGGPITNLSAGTVSAVAGYNFMDGQLVLGIGASAGIASAVQNDVELLNLGGAGVSFGGIAAPKGEPYRFGFTVRSRSRLRPKEGMAVGSRVGNLIVPRSIVLPAQFTVGMSYSVGALANNMPATFGTRELTDEDRLPESREIATIAMDLVFTERLDGVAGFQAWAEDELQVAGEEVSIGFHVGVEGELIENLLKTRMGFYFEPSRFDDVGRIHATGGADLYLFNVIWDWRLAAAIDAARNYSNVILSLGFWH